jgi:hypothetical protein
MAQAAMDQRPQTTGAVSFGDGGCEHRGLRAGVHRLRGRSQVGTGYLGPVSHPVPDDFALRMMGLLPASMTPEEVLALFRKIREQGVALSLAATD